MKEKIHRKDLALCLAQSKSLALILFLYPGKPLSLGPCLLPPFCLQLHLALCGLRHLGWHHPVA